ncbi:MAG: MFS transporter [Promethearchaeota archaeon]|jgi:GPH family glycoside/pentoside/hexuronide:cation symporter
MSEERTRTLKQKLLFATSAFGDQLTYQAFTIYVFTFYFAVVGLTMFEMWIGFILWGLWNMVNDPLLGALSERTKQKGKLGKRKFYLLISFIPLALMMIVLFTVPANFEFVYFILIIFTFEFFYTMFSVNTNAIFPEMFPTEQERGGVNMFIKAFTMIAVILASLIPTIIIKPLVPTIDPLIDPTGYAAEVASIKSMYIISGVILFVIVLIMSILFIFLSVEEKEENEAAFEKRPGFYESIKITLSNKTFLKFTLGNMLVWYCFNLLLTVFPLFAVFILGHAEGTLMIGITLMIALLSAAIFQPIQSRIRAKVGTRKGLMLGLGIWIITLLPLIFLSNNAMSRTLAMVIFFTIGFGLSAALFYIDLIHGDVIDQDSLKFGVKRAASYYGVNAFIHRFSTILVITTIYIIFSGTGWSSYEPIIADPALRDLGLKALMFVFPAVALIGAIFFFKSYDLHGEKLKNMRDELEQHPELKPK